MFRVRRVFKETSWRLLIEERLGTRSTSSKVSPVSNLSNPFFPNATLAPFQNFPDVKSTLVWKNILVYPESEFRLIFLC